MELIRIGPKLWIVNNDQGQAIIMTADEIEASQLYFQIEQINKQHQPVKLITQHRRLDGLKKANLVRQRRVMSQIVPD